MTSEQQQRHAHLAPPPELHAPALGLLIQRPGVVHAYWALDPAEFVRRPWLRLCTASRVLAELALPTARGRCYIHIDPLITPELHLQLGWRDGQGDWQLLLERAHRAQPRRGSVDATGPALGGADVGAPSGWYGPGGPSG